MTALRWRSATYHDNGLFQTFTCTEDLRLEVHLTARRLQEVHPRPWEWDVQDAIQRFRIKGRSWTVRIGLDHDGLGAVLISQEIEKGIHYDLALGAVARRLRGEGGAIADEMMADTVDHILARCVEAELDGDVLLTGRIDQRNGASKKMCTRAGLRRPKDDEADENGYEHWRREVSIPQPPLFDA